MLCVACELTGATCRGSSRRSSGVSGSRSSRACVRLAPACMRVPLRGGQDGRPLVRLRRRAQQPGCAALRGPSRGAEPMLRHRTLPCATTSSSTGSGPGSTGAASPGFPYASVHRRATAAHCHPCAAAPPARRTPRCPGHAPAAARWPAPAAPPTPAAGRPVGPRLRRGWDPRFAGVGGHAVRRRGTGSALTPRSTRRAGMDSSRNSSQGSGRRLHPVGVVEAFSREDRQEPA